MSAVEESFDEAWTEIANEDMAIGGERDANQNMRWLRRVEGRMAGKREQHARIVEDLQREMAEADAWLAKEIGPLESFKLLLEGRLTNWYLEFIAEHPKAKKTVELPSGEIRSQAGRVSVQIADEAAVLEWARANDHPELIETPGPIYPRPRLVKAAVKEMAAKIPEKDGEEIEAYTSDGEQIPGVVLVHGERDVKIVTTEVLR